MLKSKTQLKEAPNSIYIYINKYYKGAFISDIVTEMDEHHFFYYNVSASLEDAVYHLKFNPSGDIVNTTMESLLEFNIENFCDYDLI